MELIKFNFEELVNRMLQDDDFSLIFDQERVGIPYIWAMADLIQEVQSKRKIAADHEKHLTALSNWVARLPEDPYPDEDDDMPDPLDELPDFSVAPDMPENQVDVIQWADELVEKGDFVVLDTETTGLDGYPVQVAVIDPDGKVLFDEMVKPPDGVEMHPKAQAVHGITLDALKDKPEWGELVDRFKDSVRDKRVVIYNAKFDIGIIKRVMDHYQKAMIPWKSAECAMEQYAEYNGDWNDYHRNYRWVALTEAARALGVPVADAHDAKGDCVMTLGVIKALAAKARSDKPVSKEIPW